MASYLYHHKKEDDHSNFRIHVCFLARHIYVFPSSSCHKAISVARKNKEPVKKAGQPGVILTTSNGYAVPVYDIDQVVGIEIPDDVCKKHAFSANTDTSFKGRMAVLIVTEMLKRNLIPLPLQIKLIKDKTLQIKECDITIRSSLVLQVKCDYKGGSKAHSKYATGNLYLETAERNYLKKY